MDTGLRDKVVLITGAASGIGRATALAFAKEGAVLALVDRDENGLISLSSSLSDSDARSTISVADLSTADGVHYGLDSAVEQHGGRLDVLVNNVGMVEGKAFDELTDDHWERGFAINLMSNVRATRKLLPHLRASRGVIINNASDLARQPEPIPTDYGAFKAAILSVTKSVARAEAPIVRVNAVAPGPIWTPLWSAPGGFAESLSALHRMPLRQAVDYEMQLRRLPLARMGEPEEVANVIVFLASSLASFVTSAVWGVDGGSTRSIT